MGSSPPSTVSTVVPVIIPIIGGVTAATTASTVGTAAQAGCMCLGAKIATGIFVGGIGLLVVGGAIYVIVKMYKGRKKYQHIF
jgi:hypothetical protein